MNFEIFNPSLALKLLGINLQENEDCDTKRPIEGIDLGMITFEEAERFQKSVFNRVKNRDIKGALLFCQHYPVITLGRSMKKGNILAKEGLLKEKGINICKAERGGDVTYHAPGQLVIYPIFNLDYFKRDIHYFLRKLEDMAINILRLFSIGAEIKKGFTGVWIGQKKIASIGICVRNWISYHGLAINVEAGMLPNFSLIRPCGMDIIMTSMESILNKEIAVRKVKDNIIGR